MRIHGMLETSRANGPGLRSVIWTQGCTLNCPNCWNPETHSPTAGTEMLTQEIYQWIFHQYEVHRIEGVTFSGGEPMQQAVYVRHVIRSVHYVMPWLSFGMYTGYTEEELAAGRYLSGNDFVSDRIAVWKEISERIDFAVMGRYNQLIPVNRPLVSSANQNLRLFGRRYRESDFEPQEVELVIAADGSHATLTGFPVV